MKNKLLKTLTPLVLVVLLVATLTSVFVLTAGAADTTGTATLTFDDKAKRTDFSTSKQVWKENGITFTNSKGSSTSDVNSAVAPVRLYAKSSVTIEYEGGNIEKIVVDCNSISYANSLEDSITDGSTVSVSSDIVTITLKTPAPTYTITLGAQVRVDSIVVTYSSNSVEVTPCDHTNTTEVAEVPATCTTPGTEAGVYCEDCKTFISGHEEIPATGHTYERGVCKLCGEIQPTKITINRGSFGEKLSGNYGWYNWSDTTTGAMITGSGFIYATTKNSIQMNPDKGGSLIFNTDALPGKIVSITLTAASGTPRDFYVLTSDTAFGQSAPNIDKEKDTAKNVTTAGATWEFTTTDRYFAIVVTGGAAYLSSIEITYEVCYHDNKENIEEKPATCTEDGYTAGVYCNDCKTYISGHEVIPATGHQNTKEVAEAPATCTEKGYTAGVYCNDCETYISGHAEIPATGHTDDDKNYICDACGANLCKEHDWKLTSSTATCIEAGTGTYTCSACGDTKTETVRATGHTEVIDEAKASTCTEEGLTEGKHCSVCGEVLVAQETVAIINHIYENGSCTMCGKTEPVLPFKVGDIVIFTGSQANGTDTQELTGFEVGNTYGTATGYNNAPEGTFLITVVEGYQSGTFAFKNGDKYITCNGAKDVNLSTTLDAKSSWTVNLSVNDELEIISCSNKSYYLQYNPSAPRFTTYTGTQQPIKVVKVISVTTVGASLNTGVTIRVTYDILGAWLNDNAGAKVAFTCAGETKTFDAVSGLHTYYVNLASHLINKDITVQVVDSEGNALTTPQNVSLSTYRAKLEAANATDLEMTEDKKTKALALIDAALTHSAYASGESTEDITLTKDEFVASEVVKNFAESITVKANLSAKIRLIIGITSGVKPTVTVGGQDVECTYVDNVLTIGGLYHTKFNDEIIISVDGTAVLTFSFNSYLRAIYFSDAASDKNLAAATYLYGVAAEEYIKAE